jgi:hypothetical protein
MSSELLTTEHNQILNSFPQHLPPPTIKKFIISDYLANLYLNYPDLYPDLYKKSKIDSFANAITLCYSLRDQKRITLVPDRDIFNNPTIDSFCLGCCNLRQKQKVFYCELVVRRPELGTIT